jgi:hypothetical protein
LALILVPPGLIGSIYHVANIPRPLLYHPLYYHIIGIF